MVHGPDVDFARAGSLSIGYQQWGSPSGEPVLLVPPLAQNLDLLWEDPQYAAWAQRLGTSAHMISYDKRGTGVSDRTSNSYSLDAQTADLHAVLDACGVDAAFIIGCSDGGLVGLYAAAVAPERVRGLALVNSAAGYLDVPEEERDLVRARTRQLAELLAVSWGTADCPYIPVFAPSRIHDERYRSWLHRYLRQASSPGHVLEMFEAKLETDPDSILDLISTLTILITNTGDGYTPPSCSRYLAERLENAVLIEHDGVDHLPWCGPTAAAIAENITDFTRSNNADVAHHRLRHLATVLVTDIVRSTEMLARVGDGAWQAYMDTHERLSALFVADHGGRLVKSTGDGMMAVFDGPTTAIKCAEALRSRLSVEGLDIRAGVHTGEVLDRHDDLSGITVNIAVRVTELCPESAIFVTQTVRDLVGGSGIDLESIGTHSLKGVPGEWEIYDACLG